MGQTRGMADALERITNLVALLLETRSPLTLEQIANELAGQYPAGEAALRGAFERDKALLRDIGVPLETEVLAGSDAGRTAYRIDRRRYELADLALTADERAALELAVAMVRLADARFGLLKLGAGDGEPSAVVVNVPELVALPVLRDATAARAEVAFRYREADRRLQPYALLLREGFWYVIGHDLGHGEVRTYRVDRIEGRVATGESGSFERPSGFDRGQPSRRTRSCWAMGPRQGRRYLSMPRVPLRSSASSAVRRWCRDAPMALWWWKSPAQTWQPSFPGCSDGVSTLRFLPPSTFGSSSSIGY